MGMLKQVNPATGAVEDVNIKNIPTDGLLKVFMSLGQQFTYILEAMASIEEEAARRGVPLDIPDEVREVLDTFAETQPLAGPAQGGTQ